MRTTICVLAWMAASSSALACDPDTGERVQSVALRWNGEPIVHYEATGDIKRVALPNGFELGVRIEPASAEKYAELAKQSKRTAELVHIQLFDLSQSPPRRLTHTWGGANSIQGFGADGGADRVEALGSPGVSMTLLKPVCAAAP